MTEQVRRPGPPTSKPGPAPGISPAEFQTLKTKVADLDQQLQEALSERNQWNQVLRKWQEKHKWLAFTLLNGEEVLGSILWIDRYTIGIRTGTPTTQTPAEDEDPVIVHKGAIATVSVWSHKEPSPR